MFKRALLALAASVTILMPVHATSVLPLYFSEIVDTSVVAFEGTVTENRSARDIDGRPVTFTTFRIHEALKGAVGEAYTIKQIGGDLPAEGVKYEVRGVPKFAVGASYVVFLYGVSRKGFSSPVGLEQGRFMIGVDELGKSHVSNGRDFRDMARELVETLPTEKAKIDQPIRKLGLDEFKQAVRAHVSKPRETGAQ